MKINSNWFKEILKNHDLVFNKSLEINLIKNKNNYWYFPQLNFKNYKKYSLLPGINAHTEFCKFKLDLPKTSGVYLWTVDNEIIYIGEAVNLYSRFNSGYGNISPRNCYKGGQSTNIKMNKVVVSYFKKHKTIKIYYFLSKDHKNIEKYLLQNIKTKYNKKLNSK